tara:strand:+ start:9610 stop:10158 length:549 start_codon:yes stop_codon:yes gene_type:complete
MRALCAVMGLTLLICASAFSHMAKTPVFNRIGTREYIRDMDVCSMFRIHANFLYRMKQAMQEEPVCVLILDNDQLSTTKAREIYRRMCASRNVFVFGVGRKLGSYLTINYSPNYTHISCGSTKDAADALIMLLVMRIFCLYKDMSKSPGSSIAYSIVSRDRVFEQLRSTFQSCGLVVSLEKS